MIRTTLELASKGILLHKTSFSVQKACENRDHILVFDLGGTWFRCGLMNEFNQVQLLDKRPARTIWNCNGSMDRAQKELISYIIQMATQTRENVNTRTVAVSIGAAVNMLTDRVIGSAPLWGDYQCDIDFADILTTEAPEFSWIIANDVTALAMRLLTIINPGQHTHVAALTVSSGIAYRTIELTTGHIAVDPQYGMQGEVGHLPTQAFWRGDRIEARCDCGALNHISAFASGRAIKSLLACLPGLAELRAPHMSNTEGEPRTADSAATQQLANALNDGHPLALEFLDFVTLPVAQMLTYQFTLNPQVTYTVVSGGVADGLGPRYLDSLVRNLRDLGLYGVPVDNESFFRRRLGRGSPDGLDALRGVAIFARGVV
jgi:2-epi-5-epi-valiolone 7-kinase